MLTPEELAYMRETQTDARPTSALLFAQTTAGGSDGMGGRTGSYPTGGEPIQVRLTRMSDMTSTDDVPTNLADRYGASDLLRCTADLLPLRDGDMIQATESGEWFRVVSDGTILAWTTAQVVWVTTAAAPRRG